MQNLLKNLGFPDLSKLKPRKEEYNIGQIDNRELEELHTINYKKMLIIVL